MADTTKIQWTDTTWNPIRGCSRVSAGCVHCYAEKMAARFKGPGMPYEGLIDRHNRWNGSVAMIPHKLGDPLRWRRPRRVFVNSMSDLFHESLTVVQIDRVFGVMVGAPQHTYQVLTKRADRMLEYRSQDRREHWLRALAAYDDDTPEPERVLRRRAAERLGRLGIPAVPPNIHLGVSVEDARVRSRAVALAATPAAVQFLSVEPMLGPVDLRPFLEAPQGPETQRWVILGGESGQGARPCDTRWLDAAVAQCRAYGFPVFVKQLGSNAREDGVPLSLRHPKGGDPEEWPEHLRHREFPAEVSHG